MPAKKQDTMRDRIDEARKGRKMPPKEGYEISADGKEVRTPTAGEFFGNLDKASRLDEPKD